MIFSIKSLREDMIILLTGPTGSGKTGTSWALLEIMQELVFLDCDWFASLKPLSWEKESDVEVVYQALSTMIDFHIQKGNKNFVITLTMEMALVYQKYDHYFISKNMKTYPFRLHCNGQELSRRILQRDRIEVQKQQELKNSVVQQELFDKNFPGSTIFYLIEGTGKTEQQVAHQILSEIRKAIRIN